ncbi:MAG: restriction endonuclease subunit S [Thauera sp.]
MSAALLENFDLLAASLGGIAKLRELILSLAVRGRLVPQAPNDEPASELLKRIRVEKDRLIKEGKIKCDKPLAAVSDDERPFQLPVGWEWAPLSALLSKIGAGSTPLGGKEVYTNSGVKFLRSQNVWNDGLHLTDVALIPAEVHARMSGTVVLGQDILFNITGASIGRCALVPEDFDEANVSQHVTIIRPALPEIRHFLHLVLTSSHVQQKVMEVQVGVSREGLSIGKLGQFLIPLPPLAEQSRIVAKVEELMALCDRLEAEQGHAARVQGHWVEAALDQLAESADADEFCRHWQHLAAHFDTLFTTPESIDRLDATLLQLAVRGKLVPQDPNDEPASELLKQIRAEKDRLIKEGKIKRDKPLAPISDGEKPYELPAGWEWVSINDVQRCVENAITDGPFGANLKSEHYVDFGKHRVIRLQNIGRGEFITHHIALIEEAHFNRLSKHHVRCGDIVVAGLVDEGIRSCIIPESVCPALVKADCYRLSVHEGVSTNYISYYLNSKVAGLLATKHHHGLTLTRIGLGNFRSIPVPLPPLAEQSRIVAQVEKLLALTASLKARLTAAQTKQAHLAEALIAEVTTPIGAALLEGENSEPPQPFDLAAFKARMKAEHD